MKRLLTGILIIALTLSLGVTAYAATPATVAAAETQAHPGDIVNVAVTVADNPGMDVMKLKFSYDATALVLKDMLPGDVMTGAFTPNPEKAVVLLEAAGKENESGNGTLVTLKFEVKSTAPAKDYAVEFLVAEAVDRAGNGVALRTDAGVIRVTVPTPTYTEFRRQRRHGNNGKCGECPRRCVYAPRKRLYRPRGQTVRGLGNQRDRFCYSGCRLQRDGEHDILRRVGGYPAHA